MIDEDHTPACSCVGVPNNSTTPQAGMKGEWGCAGTDLWDTDGSAVGKNGTYGGFLCNDAAVRIIEQHPEPDANPLFIYLATRWHNPVQVPHGANDSYTKVYAATATPANATAALKRPGDMEPHARDPPLGSCLEGYGLACQQFSSAR